MEYTKATQEEVESVKKKGWARLKRELEGDTKGSRGLKLTDMPGKKEGMV